MSIKLEVVKIVLRWVLSPLSRLVAFLGRRSRQAYMVEVCQPSDFGVDESVSLVARPQ